MARMINLGWKEPDPNAPFTIHIRPKPASDSKTGPKQSAPYGQPKPARSLSGHASERSAASPTLSSRQRAERSDGLPTAPGSGETGLGECVARGVGLVFSR